MSADSVHYISCHPIDLAAKDIQPVKISGKSDVAEYAKDLLEKILTSDDQRDYAFESDTTEVRAAIIRMRGGSDGGGDAQVIANRLLREEKDAQKKVEHMGVELQKGSLFQLVFQNDGSEMILLTKVDSLLFLDEEDLKQHAGLPFDRRVLKTCLVKFKKNGDIASVTVSSKNNAEYWWKRFLELKEVTTDEINTTTAFHAIDGHLVNRLKKNFGSDYTYLRRNLVGYFQTQKKFNISTFVDTALGDYQPQNKELNLEKLKSEIKELPKKKNFDASFDVVADKVQSRFKRIVDLTEKIRLEVSEDAADVGAAIESKVVNGKKGVFIKSDKGYETFLKGS